MKFNERLKELRTEEGITQKELARLMDTTNSSICDWECGRTEPNIQQLVKLAEIFSVSVDYIVGKEDMPIRPY